MGVYLVPAGTCCARVNITQVFVAIIERHLEGDVLDNRQLYYSCRLLSNHALAADTARCLCQHNTSPAGHLATSIEKYMQASQQLVEYLLLTQFWNVVCSCCAYVSSDRHPEKSTDLLIVYFSSEVGKQL